METVAPVQVSYASELKDPLVERNERVRDKLHSMMFSERLPELSANLDSALEGAMEYRKLAEDTYNEHSQLVKKRLSPLAENAEKQVNYVRDKAGKFIDDRLSESKVSRTELSLPRLVQVLALATYKWLVERLMELYKICMDRVWSVRNQISKDNCIEGSLHFYSQWLTLLAFAMYSEIMLYLPIDKRNFEQRIIKIKGDYVDPAYTCCNDLVGNVVDRVQEVVVPVQDLCERFMFRLWTLKSEIDGIFLTGPLSSKYIQPNIDTGNINYCDTNGASNSEQKPTCASVAASNTPVDG